MTYGTELGPMKVLRSGNDRPKNGHTQVKDSALHIKVSQERKLSYGLSS